MIRVTVGEVSGSLTVESIDEQTRRVTYRCTCGAVGGAVVDRFRTIAKQAGCKQCRAWATKPKEIAVGTTFGDLTAVRALGVGGRWECRCTCGAAYETDGHALVSGRRQRCPACARTKQAEGMRRFWGAKEREAPHRAHPAYPAWRAMRSRCLNPRSKDYPKYGARGITICARWDDFGAFLADMGPRPSLRHTLDRYPNQAGNYEPGNVRWATYEEQARNRKNNVYLTHNGETLLAIEWARRIGITESAIHTRIRFGWSVERILTQPQRAPRTRRKHVAA